jgi:ABC-2 type transport system permease protein
MDVLKFVLMIFLWISIYKQSGSIKDFTLVEMISYYLITGFSSIFTMSEAHYIMSDEIRKGKISLYLIKPINYRRRLRFESMGRTLGIAIIALPISLISMFVLSNFFEINLNISFISIIGFILYLPLIMILMFEFTFLFGTLMIYTENDFGLSVLMVVTVVALSGQLIPLALYPDSLFGFVNILPFKFISYPPLILIGKLADKEILQGLITLLIWVIVFSGTNFFVFKSSIKKMVVFGG